MDIDLPNFQIGKAFHLVWKKEAGLTLMSIVLIVIIQKVMLPELKFSLIMLCNLICFIMAYIGMDILSEFYLLNHS